MTEWNAACLPDTVLEVMFCYLDLRDLRNCSLVCKNWYRYLNDENNDVWRLHCIRKLAEEALKSDLLSSVPTYKAKLRACKCVMGTDCEIDKSHCCVLLKTMNVCFLIDPIISGHHAWNPNDCSRNVIKIFNCRKMNEILLIFRNKNLLQVYIKANGFTLHRYVSFIVNLIIDCLRRKYFWHPSNKIVSFCA